MKYEIETTNIFDKWLVGINSDGKIGIEEAVYVLQQVSE